MLKRADAGDFGEVRGPLFDGPAAGDCSAPFAESKVAPDRKERAIAEMIWAHQGRANPISIATLARATGWTERDIKGIVEQLVVTHRMKIGGKRGEPVGYFIVVDLEDLEAAVRPYRDQIFAMWRRLRVLMSRHALAEMAGQLAMSADRAPGESGGGLER
jgi:hypothetical protein